MFILIWCIVGFISGILNILASFFFDKEDIVIKDIWTVLLNTILGWVSAVILIYLIIMKISDEYGDKVIIKAKK